MFRQILRIVICVRGAAGVSTRSCSMNVPTELGVPPLRMSLLTTKLRVATEETNSAVATVGMFIEAGPKSEHPQNNGITHLFEHMAYKTFTSKYKTDFEQWVACMGFKLKAHTTRDMVAFYTTCQTEDAPTVVDILAQVLFESDLRESEIREERCTICQEVLDYDRDIKRMVFDYLHQTAYQGTPLAQTIQGLTANIANFNKTNVHNYMCDQFQPWRIVLATSGGLSHDTMLKCAKQKFGSFEGYPCSCQDPTPSRFTGSQINFRNDALPFAHVAIAVEAPGFVDSDYIPMLVASCIIGSWDRSQGGGERNASYMARAMAVTGICESFESFYIAYKDTGLWGVYFVANGHDLEDIVYNIQTQWLSLCIGTTSAEVERGANVAKMKLAKTVANSEASCIDLARQTLYTGSRRSVAELSQAASDMKPGSIAKVANKWIYDKCPAIASVGPTEALPEYTRIRAGMYWLRI